MSKENYDVLKLIEQNQYSYASSECVSGMTLPEWLKYHPQVEKEQLFCWISGMFAGLEQIHRCRGTPCYRYVNPYSLIVDEEKRIWFLDFESEANAEQEKRMQRRIIREYFLPPEESYYQRESIRLDYYGLGKTIQYLLARTETEPRLKRREERKFSRLITKCLDWNSNRTIKEYSELSKLIPKCKKKTGEASKGKRSPKSKKTAKILILLAILLLVAAGIMICQQQKIAKRERQENLGLKIKRKTIDETEKEENKQEEQQPGGKQELLEKKELQEKTPEDISAPEEISAKMELGLLYFLECEDYEKSKECFACLKDDELAWQLMVLSQAMGGEELEEESLREVLRLAKEKADERNNEERNSYYECILRGYSYLNSKDDAKERLELAVLCLEKAGKKRRAEIIGNMAVAYEQLGQYEEAVKMYEEQKDLETDDAVKIGLYQKAAKLMSQHEETEKAQEELRKGIKEYPQSMELRIQIIEEQFMDSEIPREICIQTIQEAMAECPGLSEREELQKLLKQNGLKIEGGVICEDK